MRSASVSLRKVAPNPGVPRVALIHSLALDRSVWDGVVARLKDEAEILTFDCRGHGRSPRTPGPYTAHMFARDLVELLQDFRRDRDADAAVLFRRDRFRLAMDIDTVLARLLLGAAEDLEGLLHVGMDRIRLAETLDLDRAEEMAHGRP